jgi:LytR cell envelope-related transcriptional attenuator
VSAVLIAASSLGNVVERIGAYGGLASMIGLGVLALLYFAQAREVKRLREWAGRAPERAAEIEQRVQTDAQRRVIAQPQTPAAVAQVGNLLPPSVPSPTAGLTGEAATRAAAAAIVAARATHPPAVGPPGQLARPAVPPAGTPGSPAPAPSPAAGAVPRAPVTPPAPGSVPQAPSPAVTGALPGATTQRPPELPPLPTPPARPASPPSSVAAMAAKPPTATVATPPAPGGTKPRVVAQPAALANGNLGQETRESAAARPEPPPPPPRTPTASSAGQSSGDDDPTSPYRIAGIVGIGLLAVLIVGAIVLLMGGSDSPKKQGNTLGVAPPAQKSPDQNTTNTPPAATVDPGATPTTVLNGTTTAGLARSVASKLEAKGYKIAEVKDFVDQTLPETIVYYTDGNKRAAEAVAKAIGVSANAVQPVDRNIDVSSPGAHVVVTVGSDLIG